MWNSDRSIRVRPGVLDTVPTSVTARPSSSLPDHSVVGEGSGVIHGHPRLCQHITVNGKYLGINRGDCRCLGE